MGQLLGADQSALSLWLSTEGASPESLLLALRLWQWGKLSTEACAQIGLMPSSGLRQDFFSAPHLETLLEVFKVRESLLLLACISHGLIVVLWACLGPNAKTRGDLIFVGCKGSNDPSWVYLFLTEQFLKLHSQSMQGASHSHPRLHSVWYVVSELLFSEPDSGSEAPGKKNSKKKDNGDKANGPVSVLAHCLRPFTLWSSM